MKQIKTIFILLIFNFCHSQEFYALKETLHVRDSINGTQYKTRETVYNKEGLEAFIKKTKKLIRTTSKVKGKPYFITNRIEIRNDSIINYGIIAYMQDNAKQDGVLKLINKPLPYFKLERYKGGSLNSADLKGKPAVVNFWFAACPPCVAEIPSLNKIKEKYGSKLNYIAITFDDRAKVYNFLKRFAFDFDILINAEKYLAQAENTGYPKLLVLDEKGIIKYAGYGLPANDEDKAYTQKELEEFYEIIDRLLN
ncbi:MAG TPA: TlpA disulfide reductase family protein [Flavobacterium sp.]|nr:TlpA disulfide reductase family protein [Flavobacterium sp.]